MENKRVVLLLTGCVCPNCGDTLEVSNAFVRRKMYEDAIVWYINHTNYDIVFCENSGTDISGRFSVRDKQRVEFLTYRSQPNSSDYCTRGYREMEIIEYALKNSCSLSTADVIMKGTGRLILKNVVKVVRELTYRKGENLICTEWSGRDKWMDTRFLFLTPPVLRSLVKKKHCITSNYAFENVMTDVALEAMKEGTRFIIPCVPYMIEGCGAGNGNNYHGSTKQRLRKYIQLLHRKVLQRLGRYPQILRNSLPKEY